MPILDARVQPPAECSATVVNFAEDSRVYVAEPTWIAGECVFLNDLEPQQRTLFEGFISAQLPRYGTLEAFRADERPLGDAPGTLNVMGFFQPINTVTGFAHRQRPVFKRLQIIRPEIVTALEDALSDAHRFAHLKVDTLTALWQTYNIMCELVDIREADSADYLKR